MPCPKCNRKWRKVEGKYAVCECGNEEELEEVFKQFKEDSQGVNDNP